MPLPPRACTWTGRYPLPLIEAVLAEEHLKLEQFKLKGRDMFFQGERPAAFWPEHFQPESANDQRRSGKLAMPAFDLPPRLHATMLVSADADGMTFLRKYSSVRFSPSRRSTFGSQPSNVLPR